MSWLFLALVITKSKFSANVSKDQTSKHQSGVRKGLLIKKAPSKMMGGLTVPSMHLFHWTRLRVFLRGWGTGGNVVTGGPWNLVIYGKGASTLELPRLGKETQNKPEAQAKPPSVTGLINANLWSTVLFLVSENQWNSEPVSNSPWKIWVFSVFSAPFNWVNELHLLSVEGLWFCKLT